LDIAENISYLHEILQLFRYALREIRPITLLCLTIRLMRKTSLPVIFIFLCGFFLFACKPPRCPIKDCQVRMKHYHDGEIYRPRTGPTTEPAFQTDATRVNEEPKGLKKIFGKIFRKKAKAGPDENDLKIEINNTATARTDTLPDTLFYSRLLPDPKGASKIEGVRQKIKIPYSNADYNSYRTVMKPSMGPEVMLADPEVEYKGVPWWYHNKNPKIAYDYKPGKRYPGYRRTGMKEWKKFLAKRAKWVADSSKRPKPDTSQKMRQDEEDIDMTNPNKQPQPATDIFDEPKKEKKGLKGLFKRKKKEKKSKTQDPPAAEEPKKEEPAKEGF
jgi:hypothetical protein